MALDLTTGFRLRSDEPIDTRLVVATKSVMKNANPDELYDGLVAFCLEDNKEYFYRESNANDAATGKFAQVFVPAENVGTADPYELTEATATQLGGIMIGYVANGSKVPVQLEGGKAFVEIPASQKYHIISETEYNAKQQAGELNNKEVYFITE